MFAFVIASWIQFVLLILTLGVEVWAFINAVRFSNDAYNATFRRPKGFWVALTGGALAVGVLSFLSGGRLFLLSMVAVCVAGVFLADMLPNLKRVTGR
ncbi:DUF2516 family protein [Helcobacillus massiliensis]|uniref:DUF2516 family protein n=1 Tax=Helcobacillus massiliensis TaxID=521392 RepID=UPI0025560C9C|nr:DUF2516 family protein [Helcobacillus massiliensis]MDK7741989.1 DUF2516 family protein [Helcobacillus massiliensis]WOO93100.1 DUF2516 family protein [Helcobacillus massiliensis]